MKKAIVVAYLCLVGLTLLASEPLIARGFVFVDTNADGAMQPGEKGLEGALVSNGRSIVKTDASGHYQIELEESGHLFVIKPQGYKTQINQAMLPRFFYIHRDKEPTCHQYPGIEPTGPLPKEINFPLTRQEEPENFKFVLFGDSQPKTMTQVDYLDRDVVNELVGVKDVAFGVSLGDITDDNPVLFSAVNDVIARIGVPWYNVIGNHDQNYDVATDAEANQSFEATYGPATYAFNYGKAHFIILDDIIYKGFNPRSSGYIGGFSPSALEFLKADLSYVDHDSPVFLMMHIPLFSKEWDPDLFRTEDRETLFELLKPFKSTLSISGHTHIQRQYYYTSELGWKGQGEHYHFNVGTTCGSWWSGEPDEEGIPATIMMDGTPNGYAVVTCKDGSYQIDYKAARKPKSYQMSVFAPRVVKRGEYPNGILYVNFFMGGEKTKVFYKIDDAEKWKKMWRNPGPDPYVNALYVKYDWVEHTLPGIRTGPPDTCEHLWRFRIPTSLPVGRHNCTVKVVDQWDREFLSSISFRLED